MQIEEGVIRRSRRHNSSFIRKPNSIIVLSFIQNISRAPNAQNEFNRVLTVGKVHKYTTTFAFKFDLNFKNSVTFIKFLVLYNVDI